jgi:hypothetical protein
MAASLCAVCSGSMVIKLVEADPSDDASELRVRRVRPYANLQRSRGKQLMGKEATMPRDLRPEEFRVEVKHPCPLPDRYTWQIHAPVGSFPSANRRANTAPGKRRVRPAKKRWRSGFGAKSAQSAISAAASFIGHVLLFSSVPRQVSGHKGGIARGLYGKHDGRRRSYVLDLGGSCPSTELPIIIA